MIGDAEKRRRARALGVADEVVEKDFILACLLAGYAADPEPFVFRGGTCLARAYWPDYRLSEDVDLIADRPEMDLNRWLVQVVSAAEDLARVSLELKYEGARDGRSRSVVRWPAGDLLVDVNLGERAATPLETRVLDLPYEDLAGVEAAVPVVGLAEIMANKWFMLEDRREPRDLFDLWYGLCRAGVDFAMVAEAHMAKYGYGPQVQFLDTAAKRLGEAWQIRLTHQIAALPGFDSVVAQVRAVYSSWSNP